MKRQTRLRLAAMTLTIALLFGSSLGVITAGAVDEEEPYREYRPERQMPEAPQWAQTEVTCQSGDNTLRGTLTRPKEVGDGVPVAILLHGLGSNRKWLEDIAWYLADNGIASVRFDFAGTGESDGAQEDMTISSEVQDTLAILDYVEHLSFADTDNIFVVGKSMGAVDAVLAAKARGNEIKAMCLWYPGFGIAEAVRHGFLLGHFFDPSNPPETLEAVGYTFGRDFLLEAQQIDCEEACASYDGPVLILHGDRDFVAPMVFSLEAEHIFPDCTLKVIPGGYHGFWGYQEMQALSDTLTFLQEQIN